jgi:hypothetical protein
MERIGLIGFIFDRSIASMIIYEAGWTETENASSLLSGEFG